MANWNSGVKWGSFLWNQPVSNSPVLTERKTRMDKVITDYSKLNPEQTITQANTHKTAMTGNADFPTPVPSAVDFDALITAASSGLNGYESTKALLEQKRAVRDDSSRALQIGLGQRANYANMTKPGDTTALTGSGLPLRGATVPVGPMAQPQDLKLKSGNVAGAVFCDWKNVKGANSYEVALLVGTDPLVGAWSPKPTVTKSECELLGLTSGNRVWVKARAIGASGTGDWSDPATAIVQ